MTGLIFGILIIVIVATHRPCRTLNNILICNACMINLTYCLNNIIVSIYGYRADWALRQPACAFRAYCFLVSCECICYSYLIHAISRLFFTVFFKYKYLATYRSHCFLIILNWICGIAFSIEPFFFDGGFAFEEESRLCTLNNRKPSVSMYGIGVAFVMPLSASIAIYAIIWYYTTRSSRRVAASGSNTVITHTPSTKREMKIVRNMLISMGVFIGGGTPLLILLLWNAIQTNNHPPESLYLVSINATSLGVTLTVIMLFSMNQQIRNIAFRYLCTERQLIQSTTVGQKLTLQVLRR